MGATGTSETSGRIRARLARALRALRGQPLRPLVSGARGADEGAVDMAAVASELLIEVLARRGRHRLVAHGGSMGGAIRSGSVIELRRVGAREAPAVGSVVAARLGHGAHRTLVVHRIVGVDAKGALLLKGDACASPDGWIGARDVLGVVVAADDGSGPRPVPAPRPLPPRWRRALGRLERAARALRDG